MLIVLSSTCYSRICTRIIICVNDIYVYTILSFYVNTNNDDNDNNMHLENNIGKEKED